MKEWEFVRADLCVKDSASNECAEDVCDVIVDHT